MKRPITYSKFVNSLSRGLTILECFTRRKQYLSLAEITKMIGVPKATVFRLLHTMRELNYLKYDFPNKKYYLGPKVLSLGFSVLQSLEVCEIARPYLEKLARECDKTVNVSMLDK